MLGCVFVGKCIKTPILGTQFQCFHISKQVNGEIEKKDDSGNETGAGEHENEEENICYDKTKSFFDSISCEAAQDRSKNKKNDWRQERKINTETFGIPAKRTGLVYCFLRTL